MHQKKKKKKKKNFPGPVESATCGCNGSRVLLKVNRARADISSDMDPVVENLADAGIVDGGATVDVSVLRAVSAMQRELAEVGLDLEAVMQRIADRTRELTGGTSAAVRLLDGDALVCGAVSGAPEIQNPHRLPLGVGPEEVVQLVEAGYGWLVAEGAVWSAAIVEVEPAGEGGVAFVA